MRFPEFDNLTIVIVTYKGDALLRGCLDSLRDAGVFGDTRGRRGSAKVVVVDNSPSAATRSLAGSYGEAVEYVVSPGNPGLPAGITAPCRFATGNTFCCSTTIPWCATRNR